MAKQPCWYECVADEFERVAEDAEAGPASRMKERAKVLASLAEAIRQDCGCGRGAANTASQQSCTMPQGNVVRLNRR